MKAPLQNTTAPQPWQERGAGATNLDAQNDTAPRVARLGSRPLPGDDLTCQTLAALRTPEGRARFNALAIGPEAFEWSDERAIANALLQGRAFTPVERTLLDRDDGRHLPWRMAISWTMSQERAVHTVNWFAANRIRWWLPRWLTWLIEALRAGQSLPWVLRELELLVASLKPIVGSEGPR